MEKPFLFSGQLFAVEGGEGSGKDTILNMISEYCNNNGYPCDILQEPGGTEVGGKIRSLLKTVSGGEEITTLTELFLFMGSRGQLYSLKVKPFIAHIEGDLVFFDRSKALNRTGGASFAHQVFQGKLREKGVITTNDFVRLNQIATLGIKIPRTVWLDVEPEVGIARKNPEEVKTDRFDSRGMDYHKGVRAGFEEYFNEIHQGGWTRIDTSKFSVEEVFCQVLAYLT